MPISNTQKNLRLAQEGYSDIARAAAEAQATIDALGIRLSALKFANKEATQLSRIALNAHPGLRGTTPLALAQHSIVAANIDAARRMLSAVAAEVGRIGPAVTDMDEIVRGALRALRS